MTSTQLTDNSSPAEVALNGVFEFGLGLGLGVLLDTLAPTPNADKGWKATGLEVIGQVGVQAVLLQSAGSFLLRRVTPGSTSSGLLLTVGLLQGQPNLSDKVRHVSAQLKLGALALASPEAAALAKGNHPAPSE